MNALRTCLMFAVIVLLLSTDIAAQEPECSPAQSFEVMHGNNIRTMFSASGDLFWDLDQARFQVPFTGAASPSAIFAGGIWLGALDANQNLKLAAQTFRNDPYHFEYTPGPLSSTGSTGPEDCANWDRVWTVFRNDILRHIADYNEDGIIDYPVASVYAWPGAKSGFFENYNGFSMPDLEHLTAPFHDLNSNNIYEPDLGDYPLPDGVDPAILPQQISWCVFNDAGATHGITYGDPLKVEVQLTSYAFTCVENELLNNTLFNSFRVVNRSEIDLDSMYFGQWLDPDLGCFSDDLMGSYPAGSSFFVYNQDNTDGTTDSLCTAYNGVLPTYGTDPPVLSVTFLEPSMSGFMYVNNPALWDGPLAMTTPDLPVGYYRLMKGLWTDGEPLQAEGSGYNENTSADTTTFAFDGDPRDPDSWSMINVVAFGDRRVIGSTSLGKLQSGEKVSITLAYAFHREEGLSNIENVGVMYDEVDLLHSIYASEFVDQCAGTDEGCDDDCVYPGDVNSDGIVDNLDYLVIATNLGKQGPQRRGPLAWQPIYGDDWTGTTPYGVNLKHADCNGDGLVDTSDFEMINFYFGQTNDKFRSRPWARHGDDIRIDFPDSLRFKGSLFDNQLELHFDQQSVDRVHGLMYTLEIDSNYFLLNAILSEPDIPAPGENVFWKLQPSANRLDFIFTFLDGVDRKLPLKLLTKGLLPWKPGAMLVNGPDTAYLSVRSAAAIMSDGTLINIFGQRHATIITEESPMYRSSSVREDGLKVYPNPSEGVVYVNLPGSWTNIQYTIVRSDGSVEDSGKAAGSQLRFELAAGVYFLTVNGKQGSLQEKFVVLE